MTKEQNEDGERIVSVSGGKLQIDLSGIESGRVMAIVAGIEPSPLDSGDFFVELETGRIHRLSLSENPPAGEYTVVVLDTEKPRRPPWSSLIQIREVRG